MTSRAETRQWSRRIVVEATLWTAEGVGLWDGRSSFLGGRFVPGVAHFDGAVAELWRIESDTKADQARRSEAAGELRAIYAEWQRADRLLRIWARGLERYCEEHLPGSELRRMARKAVRRKQTLRTAAARRLAESIARFDQLAARTRRVKVLSRRRGLQCPEYVRIRDRQKALRRVVHRGYGSVLVDRGRVRRRRGQAGTMVEVRLRTREARELWECGARSKLGLLGGVQLFDDGIVALGRVLRQARRSPRDRSRAWKEMQAIDREVATVRRRLATWQRGMDRFWREELDGEELDMAAGGKYRERLYRVSLRSGRGRRLAQLVVEFDRAATKARRMTEVARRRRILCPEYRRMADREATIRELMERGHKAVKTWRQGRSLPQPARTKRRKGGRGRSTPVVEAPGDGGET